MKTHLILSQLQRQLALQKRQLQQQIADHKQTMDALYASEEKYRTVFENIGSATVIIEIDGTISLANVEFSRISGYSRDELENLRRLDDFVPEDDRGPLRNFHRLWRVSPGSAPREYECRFIDRHGVTKDLLMTVAILPGSNKIVTSMVDITERKHFEEHLKYLSLHDPLTGLYNRTFFTRKCIILGCSM